jgi:hypothetical protein
MKNILIELILRQKTKDEMKTKIDELFILAPTPTPIKKSSIQTILLESLNLNWNVRNLILVNETLQEAGVRTTKSKGFYHFTGIQIKSIS